MTMQPPVDVQGLRIHITGIVQGVGFRPFVYNLAVRLGLLGWVKNTSAGVDILVDGPRSKLDAFIEALRSDAPALARIEDLSVAFGPANGGFRSFEIIHSEAIPSAFQPISPDVAICPDCLRELFDPADRRYRYPFINCTNCGPRFTIIKDIPYDRPATTMARFELCPDCLKEYIDPLNRRFHAQPIACPICGPRIWLELPGAASVGSPGAHEVDRLKDAITEDQAIQSTRELLRQGKIVAVKGLGGFHLACDATNANAVSELRRRKLRVDKPFAVMMPDMETIASHCVVSESEKELLLSPARPIVLLKRKVDSSIAADVAPRQDTLGIMLPYTPLHYLLMEQTQGFTPALIMTSGNVSEEPIAVENDEARRRLAPLADAFLMHDRPIHVRCDDSVVRVFSTGNNGKHLEKNAKGKGNSAPEIYPLRRSRGYAPFPVKLPWEVPPLLAAGAELKNTFCITQSNYAFLSHHIGDMENYETLTSFEQGVDHFEKLFRVKPAAIAYDLHPGYLSSQYALARASRAGVPAIGVQHHHAHIAGCMAEHGLDGSQPVIGLAFDGTGYGEDGTIWGGEFLIADYKSYKRPYHLPYFPLPGGDAAIKKPARTALALLWSLGLEWDDRLPCVSSLTAEELHVLLSQLDKKINTPLTSSMGRVFDAAAALVGVRQVVNYEGQAAIEFEALVDPSEEQSYSFLDDSREHPKDAASLNLFLGFNAMMQDTFRGVPQSKISARFHNGLANGIVGIVRKLSKDSGLRIVVLSGGVWQNLTLLGRTLSLLEKEDFQVYLHRQVPTNDGGLSLGQAVIASQRLAA